MTGFDPEELRSVARGLRQHLALIRTLGIDHAPRLCKPVEEPKPVEGPGRGPKPPPGTEPRPEPGPRPAAGGAQGRLDALRREIGDCTRCPLHAQGRSHVVFGVGNPDAEVLFVGEAPGFHEDREGIPFVGAAGQLLTRIIEGGMGVPRASVYIANVIKCRPPKNRNPVPVEVATCRPFVLRQIEIVDPKVVITLGRVALQALLQTTQPVTRARGSWLELEGRPVMPTLHPAYLLRNPAGKRLVWSDIKRVLAFLETGRTD